MNHMAQDQYGNFYHNLGKYPRKALCQRLCRKHVSKMYQDNLITKKSKCTGYVIAGLWLTVFKVMPFKD